MGKMNINQGKDLPKEWQDILYLILNLMGELWGVYFEY